jgi:hypothetical protein
VLQAATRPGATIDDIRDRVEARVGATFRTQTARRQEHRDVHTLTASGVGTCLRRAVFTMGRVPVSEPSRQDEARQAMLGTIIHEFLLPSMAELVPGSFVELPVVLKAAGLEITGTLDWLWVDPVTGDAEVGDLKTVREWALNGVVRNGVFDEHHLQVWTYALAASQAGYRVRWVWWLYMDRSTGLIKVIVEEFTVKRAYTVVQRVALIKKFATSNPDAAPREARGPGFSPVCDHCPWLRRCWGETAQPGVRGVQKILAGTEQGIHEALLLLFNASGASAAAKADADFAKVVLADVPDGVYRGLRLKRRPSGKGLRQAEARQLLLDAGLQVPEVEKEKAMLVSAVGS